MQSQLPLTEEIYTVSQLNNAARFLLEDSFRLIWIEGEISNFSAPQSGHWYFSLKDKSAQVRCALFRSIKRQINFTPKDGMLVLLRARVSLYENRGEFQLIAESMEERGTGKLQQAFEALKKKLQAAGWFDPKHKKPIPTYPKQIGVITSATGAAICDILHVLKRRFCSVPIILYPSLVQGAAAAASIVATLAKANMRHECDVLILARGGGSLEDLWPFNEEIVAKAIYDSDIPIISGIGHEIDYTIADFVADVRAPTPSAAAELATPDNAELLIHLKRQDDCLLQRMQQKLSLLNQHLNWIDKHLNQQHPRRKLQEKMQRLDFFEMALTQTITRQLGQLQKQLSQAKQHLQQQTPLTSIQVYRQQAHAREHQLQHFMTKLLHKQKTILANCAATLDAISPLATLQRGYALVHDDTGKIIRTIEQLNVRDHINVRLGNGQVQCEVKAKVK